MGVFRRVADDGAGSSSGGSMELIETKTVSGGNIEFKEVFAEDDGYADYKLVMRNLKADNDVIFRFSDDGGSTYYNNTEYFWSRRRSGSGGGGSNDGPAGGQGEIKPLFDTDDNNDPKNGVDGKYLIQGATEARPTRVTGTNVMFGEAKSTRHWNFSGGGMLAPQVAVDTIKVSAGSFLTSGEVSIYGIKK